jgi:hypothetical protein
MKRGRGRGREKGKGMEPAKSQQYMEKALG